MLASKLKFSKRGLSFVSSGTRIANGSEIKNIILEIISTAE